MSAEPLQEILLTMGGNTIKDANKMNALWDDSNDVAEEKYAGLRYVSVVGVFLKKGVSEDD
ncbi:hypothetical protein P5G61_12490 [Paenibacillus sp. F6_3S_P_1C]|uniref:Uncharacterized protein n=1 Tax=Paenibacillus vandeheii TaxID=3035917 RepID=A0ABT8JAC4_9BACL|nr:hypothetical protein [Paenibacillus vandeheii]MDN4602048.1 hypothetical protein [Paenibacillus vandeheii]